MANHAHTTTLEFATIAPGATVAQAIIADTLNVAKAAKALAEAMEDAYGGIFDIRIDLDVQMVNALVYQRESEA